MQHDTTEIIRIANFKSTTTILQALSFLEALVIRTKYDGDVPDSSLKSVMYAHAKASTDISDVSIAVDTGE